jgi:glycosyltransferase involved in cell wall biosynthesis
VTRPICSVVIPSYNGRPLLATCLASIDRHRPLDVPIEVIVADDASTDDTADWLPDAHPDVRLVRLGQNAGFCGAANAGIAASLGSFIQLLNNDTEVSSGWIEAGLAPFSEARIGSVAPLVLVRSDPSRVDSAGDSYAAFGWPSKRGHGQSARLWAERPRRIRLASGAGTLLGYLAMGWGLGVADTRGETAFARFAVPASMAAAGATVGTLQWVVLRHWVSRAGWWVLASGIGWVAAEYAYLKLTRSNDVHLLLGAVVSGAVSGAITGLTLVGLMRTTREDRPSTPA